MRSDDGCFPHPAIPEVVVQKNEALINDANDRDKTDNNDDIFPHLFPFRSAHMLWMRQKSVNGIGRLPRHISHGAVIPVRLT